MACFKSPLSSATSLLLFFLSLHYSCYNSQIAYVFKATADSSASITVPALRCLLATCGNSAVRAAKAPITFVFIGRLKAAMSLPSLHSCLQPLLTTTIRNSRLSCQSQPFSLLSPVFSDDDLLTILRTDGPVFMSFIIRHVRNMSSCNVGFALPKWHT